MHFFAPDRYLAPIGVKICMMAAPQVGLLSPLLVAIFRVSKWYFLHNMFLAYRRLFVP